MSGDHKKRTPPPGWWEIRRWARKAVDHVLWEAPELPAELVQWGLMLKFGFMVPLDHIRRRQKSRPNRRCYCCWTTDSHSVFEHGWFEYEITAGWLLRFDLDPSERVTF